MKRPLGKASPRRSAAREQGAAPFDLLRDIVGPCLLENDMEEMSSREAIASGAPLREGRFFRMPRERASGYFWIYAEAFFAVTVADLAFLHDYHERCRHPRFISVSYYRSGSYRLRDGSRSVKAPYLEGHVRKAPVWDCIFSAESPTRNVAVMLAPPFYERYLQDLYCDESFSAEKAFASIDGISDFPQMILLLEQVEAFRGRGASARLFYRSKVEEAVALVVEKSRALAGERSSVGGEGRPQDSLKDRLASEDLRAIERVRQRLDERLSEPAQAAELARLACMGQTKLRLAFKQSCGCTIVEYRQRRRCARAAELLAADDLPVSQVAALVGYRPERLAELFARLYGTTPSAYRAALR